MGNKINININKRLNSTKRYIDELSKKYSKINIVRVDLSYKKPHSDNVTLYGANKDLEHMLNNRRSKPTIFRNQIGYICKREYTKDKGIHLHTIFLYDGQKVLKDTFKADQIGKYWNEQITKGKGSYYNCNRNDYEENGIGMLEHNDSEKRKILDEKVVSYLCKGEQDIKPLKENQNDRAFTRGIVKSRGGNIGRPRRQPL